MYYLHKLIIDETSTLQAGLQQSSNLATHQNFKRYLIQWHHKSVQGLYTAPFNYYRALLPSCKPNSVVCSSYCSTCT